MNPQNSISRSVGWTLKNYRKFVTKEDLEQLCDVYILAHQDKMDIWENEYQGGEATLAEWQLYKELNKVLGRHARKEKAQQSGYQTEDESFYSLVSLAEVLPFVFARQPVPRERQEIRSKRDPALGGDWQATFMDIDGAWHRAPLSGQERSVLLHLYLDGDSQEATANILELTQAGVSKVHRRALGKLLTALGGPNPGTGCPYDCECHEGRLRARPGTRGSDDGKWQMLG
jgi:hypothetical protein